MFQRHFNFTCKCEACVNGCNNSDEHLCEIQELIDQMPSVAQFDAGKALKMSERTLRLMKVEGRDTPLDMGTIHYDAYQVAQMCGNSRKAKEHLRAAWECAKLSEGPDSALATKYASML